MKKIKIYFLLFMLAAAFTINSCKKEEKKTLSCEELASKVASSALTFAFGPTESSCTAYKNAINDYVKGCALLTPAEKKDLQDDMDDLNCSEF